MPISWEGVQLNKHFISQEIEISKVLLPHFQAICSYCVISIRWQLCWLYLFGETPDWVHSVTLPQCSEFDHTSSSLRIQIFFLTTLANWQPSHPPTPPLSETSQVFCERWSLCGLISLHVYMLSALLGDRWLAACTSTREHISSVNIYKSYKASPEILQPACMPLRAHV